MNKTTRKNAEGNMCMLTG